MLGINNDPVTIKNIELSIVERAFDEGWISRQPPATRTGKPVAVIGSGPAGLAAAEQLNQAGHLVTVFERSDRIGGLLRYGIPEFKIEKRFLDRRLDLLEQEGVLFRTGVNVGVDVPVEDLRAEFDAVVLCGGAGCGRAICRFPGVSSRAFTSPMDYLTRQNRRCEGDEVPERSAVQRRRQARHHHRRRRHRRRLPRAPRTGRARCRSISSSCCRVRRTSRLPDNPGRSGRGSSGARRRTTRAASGCSRSPPSDSWATTRAACARWRPSTSKSRRSGITRLPGTEVTLEADLVLLAMGFVGPERGGLLSQLGVRLTDRGNVWRDERWMTSEEGVFTAGDMQRGQSLIVWAIADGRHAAAAVDGYLMGESGLSAIA